MSFITTCVRSRHRHSFPTRRSSDLFHDCPDEMAAVVSQRQPHKRPTRAGIGVRRALAGEVWKRSEEHTSELQSLTNLVCRLLLEKKKRLRAGIQGEVPHGLGGGRSL